MKAPNRDASKEALKGRTCERHVPAGFRSWLCGKPAKVIEDGKAFCGVHDPERRRKRDAASTERWNAQRQQWAEQTRQRAEDARKIACHDQLVAAIEGLTPILEAAESNASGNPEWTWVSPRINAARAALAAAKVPQ